MYDITAIGNSPVDCLTKVSEETIKKYSLNKNDFNIVTTEVFSNIVEECTFEGMESGGSTANTAWTISMLGKHTYFIGHIGEDPAGKHFYNNMQQAKVDMPKPNPNAHTMEIIVLITPDGERTFASRGVSAPLEAKHINENIIKKSNYLLIEGYLTTDQTQAISTAIKMALKHKTKIAFTASADFAINLAFPYIAKEILPYINILIANDEEYKLIQQKINQITDECEKETLLKLLNNVEKVVTHSEKGATYIKNGNETYMPTTKIDNVVDATGAGDAFVAGFLYGYLENDINKALKLGNKLGGKVITQIGGRITNLEFLEQNKVA